MVLSILSISFSSCHPLFSCPLEYTSSIKSSYLTQLRQDWTKLSRTTYCAARAGWEFCACIRKQLRKTEVKGQLPELFSTALKSKGAHTNSSHWGITVQQQPVKLNGQRPLLPGQDAFENSSRAQAPPPASKEHCHGQRHLLHY